MSRYAVEYHENKSMASVHFDFPIPEFSWMRSESETTKGGLELKSRLLGINGVVEVSSHKQRLSIERGAAFTWDELIPQILKVVQSQITECGELNEVAAYSD